MRPVLREPSSSTGAVPISGNDTGKLVPTGSVKAQGSTCPGCNKTFADNTWRFCSGCGGKNPNEKPASMGFAASVQTKPETRESTMYAKSNPETDHFIGGLDGDLAAKRAATFDSGLEGAARQWVQTKTGINMSGDLHALLKDGIVLCKLANALKPGTVGKINTGKMPFTQMENINNFLAFASKSGVAQHSLFQTVDLYENKNLAQVILCLSSLSRYFP